MKSIRRSLMLGLLGGLLTLWIAAGAGVYAAVRRSLIGEVDARLAMDARVVRFAARVDGEDDARQRGGRLDGRMADYQSEDGAAYYQMWSSQGEVMEKSPSLGSQSLPVVDSEQEDVFGQATLSDGTAVRTLSFRVSGGAGVRASGKGKAKARGLANQHHVTLARSLEGVEASLNSLLGGLLLVGAAVAAGGAGLVTLVLRRGLRPLDRLAEQSTEVDASTLGARFADEGVPRELAPVYGSLNGLLERLEVSFERERRFSADLAHEMRTPVAELKMLCEVALKWPDESGPETHAQALEIVQRLEGSLESLLALAKLETGEARLNLEPVPLTPLLHECWAPCAGQAERRRLQVEWKTDESVVWETDAAVMRLVLNNLLSNLVEYTPDGGSASIEVTHAGLEIANDAPAMSEESSRHVFDRFWRADAVRADDGHCGLGLALAQQGATALGLELTSAWARGVLRFQLRNR